MRRRGEGGERERLIAEGRGGGEEGGRGGGGRPEEGEEEEDVEGMNE